MEFSNFSQEATELEAVVERVTCENGEAIASDVEENDERLISTFAGALLRPLLPFRMSS